MPIHQIFCVCGKIVNCGEFRFNVGEDEYLCIKCDKDADRRDAIHELNQIRQKINKLEAEAKTLQQRIESLST